MTIVYLLPERILGGTTAGRVGDDPPEIPPDKGGATNFIIAIFKIFSDANPYHSYYRSPCRVQVLFFLGLDHQLAH